MNLESCVLVLIGGFVGGVCRFFLSGVVGRSIGETFPWGTLVVNVSGALAIGAFAGAARTHGGILDSGMLRDFFVVGVLGGYTTVSSFCLQTLTLTSDGELSRAVFNVIALAGLCVLAVIAGYSFFAPIGG